jgi:hypothetical protein
MHWSRFMKDCAVSEMVKNVETDGERRVAVAFVRQHPVSP